MMRKLYIYIDIYALARGQHSYDTVNGIIGI